MRSKVLRGFFEGAPTDLATRKVAALLWGVPLAALLVASFVDLSPKARTSVWTVALLWAGAACLLNAWRSGRVHCHPTGPFFIILAALAFLHGSGLLSLGPRGWTLLGVVLLVGAPILTFVPEWIWGKYSKGGGRACC